MDKKEIADRVELLKKGSTVQLVCIWEMKQMPWKQ